MPDGPIPHGFFADDFEKVMSAITAAEDRLSARIDALGELIGRMDETIRGNGTPGIRQRVDQLEARHKTVATAAWLAFAAAIKTTWDLLVGALKGG